MNRGVATAAPRRSRCSRGLIHGLPVLVVAAACARPEAPPGGPEDLFPPYVIETTPDTFAVVEPGVSEVHFRFSERISERPANGNLNDAVVVSPSTGLVRVRHSRDGITVEMQEGFEAGRVYRVTVLPVINDMFQNRLRDPFDLVVSTGNEFVPNVLAGMVEDRVTGEAVPDIRVEARFPDSGDTITHWNFTDQDGVFSLRYVPDGPFEVRAWMDRNRDREVGESEPQTAFAGGALDATPDTSFTVLSLIEPDTTPARLASVTVEDSLTLRFEFDDYLDPELPGALVAAQLVVAEIEVDSTEAEAAVDSTEAEAGIEVDSAAAGAEPEPVAEPQADTLEAPEPGDTTALAQPVDTVQPSDTTALAQPVDAAQAVDTVPSRPPPEPGDTLRVRILTESEYRVLLAARADSVARATADSVAEAAAAGAAEDAPAVAGEAPADTTEEDTGPVTLSGLPLPDQTLVGVLFEPLWPGVPYEASVSRVVNIAGTGRGQGTTVVVLEVPEEEEEPPPDEDTVPPEDPGAVGDSAAAVPDTGQVADSLEVPDSLQVPDTVVVPDTLQVPDTLVVPDTVTVPDTIPVPDTLAVPDTIPVPDTARSADTVRADTAGLPARRPARRPRRR